jgi:hypothetical protein
VDDGSTGDEGRDLGFITLAAAARIAREHDAELDVDGPTREEWTAHQKRAPRRFRDLIPERRLSLQRRRVPEDLGNKRIERPQQRAELGAKCYPNKRIGND